MEDVLHVALITLRMSSTGSDIPVESGVATSSRSRFAVTPSQVFGHLETVEISENTHSLTTNQQRLEKCGAKKRAVSSVVLHNPNFSPGERVG